MGCSVAEAQARISSHEFAEWRAYDQLSPIGPERQDARIAMLTAVVANAFRGKGQPFKPDDFMPRFEPKKAQTPEEMKALLKDFAMRHNQQLEAKRKKDKKNAS